MEPDDAGQLVQVEHEDAQLKNIVADKVLENLALRENPRRKGEPVAAPPSRGHAIIPVTSIHRERTVSLIR